MFLRTLIEKAGLNSPKIILLMGGPGSGKGVLAANLSKIQHFSIGEALREIINNPKHPQAELFKHRIAQGKLLSDQEVMGVMSQADIFKHSKPVLLDGFPRTLTQRGLFKKRFGSPAAVIDLDVSKEVMQTRLLGRGRKDDQTSVIQYRIADYFNNTKPMARKILAETTKDNKLSINASNLHPEEIDDIAKTFLENKNLYPKQEITEEFTASASFKC